MDQKRNQEVITIIVSVVIIILVAYLFISPTIETLKKSNYTVATKGQDLKRAEDNLDNLKSLEATLSGSSDAVNSLITALPASVDDEDLVTSLEAMANKDGLLLSAVTPMNSGETSVAASQPSIGQAQFDLSLKGSYQNLQSFLTDLENNRRPLSVDKISMVKESAVGAGSTLNITLSITAFYSNLS